MAGVKFVSVGRTVKVALFDAVPPTVTVTLFATGGTLPGMANVNVVVVVVAVVTVVPFILIESAVAVPLNPVPEMVMVSAYFPEVGDRLVITGDAKLLTQVIKQIKSKTARATFKPNDIGNLRRGMTGADAP